MGNMRAVAKPIAPYITFFQIAQMVVGTTVTVVGAYHHAKGDECHVNAPNYRMGLAMYMSYLILFVMLFLNKYKVKPGKKGEASKEPKPNSSICGMPMNVEDTSVCGGEVDMTQKVMKKTKKSKQ